VLTTDQKGAVAESAIATAALELGIGVSRPFGDERYDLIFDLRPNLVRVQCKWARRYGEIIVVRCRSARRNADGLLARRYTAREIDAFAAYCPDTRQSYFLPLIVFEGRNQIHLRVGRARNNQELGVNWAERFEFAATIGRRGAIAQLGERRAGSAKVAGSSPAGSTSEAVSSQAASLFN
jgi:PD-(D/E)XK nuclease superfamily protein